MTRGPIKTTKKKKKSLFYLFGKFFDYAHICDIDLYQYLHVFVCLFQKLISKVRKIAGERYLVARYKLKNIYILL